MNVADRFRGCLLGLAVGDALGTTLEFCTRGNFVPITGIVGGGPFNLEPGQWTDDTSMALCLAESLIEKQGFDPADQMQRYLAWWRTGYLSSTGVCFDIGGTTASALRCYERTGDPFAGSTDSHSAGNGSIMRLAPIPMFFYREPARAIEMAGESSRTTHGNRACIDACRCLGGLIVGALRGESRERLLSPEYSPIEEGWSKSPLCPEIAEVAKGSFKTKEETEIVGSGYVVRSLEAALWAFYRSTSFEHGCLLAVNLGDDADTTGAVYGQLAGAYYGEVGIPRRWREKIAESGRILEQADRLHSLTGPQK
jgi:ADP-ribosyl-[dinitrogen reductase] hydrolase